MAIVEQKDIASVMVHLRTTNSTIPDHVLAFVQYACKECLKPSIERDEYHEGYYQALKDNNIDFSKHNDRKQLGL